MTRSFLRTALATALLTAMAATTGSIAGEERAALPTRAFRIISVERGIQSSLVAYKVRIRLEGNDRDIGLSRLIVSWPSGRGDITKINGEATGTWAADPAVDVASNPPLGSAPGNDVDISGNVRRALSAIDFFGESSFSNGDTIEFEFTAQGATPFLIRLRASGTDTLVGQNPPNSLTVDSIRGLPFLPGNDPFQRVLGRLLGQPDATAVEFLDSSSDGLIDSADLNAFAGI